MLAILMLTHPEASFEAAELGCLAVKNVVIRSLFPMMVLSRLIAHSQMAKNMCHTVAKARLWRRLRLSDALLPAVISGLISGLPAAASEVQSLVAEGVISEKEGAKAVALASVPSPAFVILAASPTVAVGVFRYAVILILSYTVASAFPSVSSPCALKSSNLSFHGAIAASATSSISVSASIIFFTSVNCLLSSLLPRMAVLWAIFFEMGSAVALANGNSLTTSAVIGWCGLSALSQIRSAAPSVSSIPYLVTRVVSCASLLLLQFFAEFLQNAL